MAQQDDLFSKILRANKTRKVNPKDRRLQPLFNQILDANRDAGRTEDTALETLHRIGAEIGVGAAGVMGSIARGGAGAVEFLAKGMQMPGQPTRPNPVSGLFEQSAEGFDILGEAARPNLPGQDLPGAAGFLTQEVPRGLGSTIPFLAGGGVLGIAGLGALAGGGQELEASDRVGVTGRKKWTSFLLGMGLGTSEAFPLGKIAGRLAGIDRRSGGVLSGIIKRAATEGTEEAAQELAQTLGSNQIARHVRGEDVEVFEGALEGAGTGGAVGAILGALIPGRRFGQAELVEEFEGIPIERPEGPIEPGRRLGQPTGLQPIGPIVRPRDEGLLEGQTLLPAAEDPSLPSLAEELRQRKDAGEELSQGEEVFLRDAEAKTPEIEAGPLAPIQDLLGPQEEATPVDELKEGPAPASAPEIDAAHAEIKRRNRDQDKTPAPVTHRETGAKGKITAPALSDDGSPAGWVEWETDSETGETPKAGRQALSTLELDFMQPETVAAPEQLPVEAQVEAVEAEQPEVTVAELPTEEGLFGEQERPEPERPAAVKEKITQPSLIDVQEGDQRGQQTIGDVVEAEALEAEKAPEELTEAQQRARAARKRRESAQKAGRASAAKRAGAEQLDLQGVIRAGGGLQFTEDLANLRESEGKPRPGQSRLAQGKGSKKGMAVDEAIERALEAGFFPGQDLGSVSPADFMEALEANTPSPAGEAAFQAQIQAEEDKRVKTFEAQAAAEGIDLDSEEVSDLAGGSSVLDWMAATGSSADVLAAEEQSLEVPPPVTDEEVEFFAGPPAPDFATDLRNFAEDQKAKSKRPLPFKDGFTIATEGFIDRQIRHVQDRLRGIKRTQEELTRAGVKVTERVDVALREELRRGVTSRALDASSKKFVQPIAKSLRRAGIQIEQFNEYLHARHAQERNAVVNKRSTEEKRRSIARKADRKIENAGRALERETKRIQAQLRGGEAALRKRLKGDALAKGLNAERATARRKIADAHIRAERKAEAAEIEAVVNTGGMKPGLEAGSGMTDSEAQEILDRVEADPRGKDYKRVAAAFDQMNKATRKVWVAGSLETQEAVDAMEKAYPNYAPLRSDLSEGEVESIGTGKGTSILGRETRFALGRSDRNVSPLEWAVAQHEMAIIRAEKNRVGQTFLGLLREMSTNGMLDGFATIHEEQPTRRALVNGMIKRVPDQRFKLNDNVLAVKVNGQEVLIEIDAAYTDVARAMKAMGPDSLEHALRHLGAMTRFLSALLTRYNPVFPIFNFTKDVGAAILNAGAEQKGLGRAVMKNVPQAFMALRHDQGFFGKGRRRSSKWAQHLQDFKDAGGEISFLDFSGLDSSRRKLQQAFNSERKIGTLGGWHRGFLDIKNWVDDANTIFENVSRLASYVAAREKLGLSKDRAALFAKDITTNFERKGEWGSVVNSMYMFANAGIQGTERVGRAVRKKGFRNVVTKAIVGLMAYDMMMRALMGVDDDGEDAWDKIPEWEKENNFIIPAFDGSGGRVNIPLPFVWSWFHSLGLNTSAMLTGNKKPGEAVGSTFRAALDAFNPLGGTRVPLQLAMPTVADPIVQVLTNRDWKNDPIHKERFPGEDTPDSELYWPDKASAASVSFTRWLNEVSGGHEFKAGDIDINPTTLDHMAKFLTGGPGRLFGRLGDLGGKISDPKEEVRAADIPIVRRLFREPSLFLAQGIFKDNLKELKAESKLAKSLGKDLPRRMAGLFGEAKDLSKEVRKANAEAAELVGAARRKRLANLDKALDNFNRRYNELQQ